LRVAAILGRMGFQSELHFGALYVRSIEGFLMWMAACSVSSKWDLDGRVLRMLMPFQVPGYSVSSGEGVVSRGRLDSVEGLALLSLRQHSCSFMGWMRSL